MCKRAAEKGGKILVLATVSTTIEPTVSRICKELDLQGKDGDVVFSLRSDAMDSLKKGNITIHDSILSEEALKFPSVDTIVLAQASMATAEEKIRIRTGKRVLSSPSSCIEEVKRFYGIS